MYGFLKNNNNDDDYNKCVYTHTVINISKNISRRYETWPQRQKPCWWISATPTLRLQHPPQSNRSSCSQEAPRPPPPAAGWWWLWWWRALGVWLQGSSSIHLLTAFSTRRVVKRERVRPGVSQRRRLLKEGQRPPRRRGRFSSRASARDPRSSSPTPRSQPRIQPPPQNQRGCSVH